MSSGPSSSKSGGRQKRQGRDGGKQEAHDVPAVQWLVAGVALVVVVASFGLVLYQGVAGNDTPPLLAVVVDSIAPDSARYRVHVTVRNTGGHAATDVRVRAEVSPGDSGPADDATDASVIRFDLLPPGSQATGVFVFASDPRAGNLQTRVVGHVVP